MSSNNARSNDIADIIMADQPKCPENQEDRPFMYVKLHAKTAYLPSRSTEYSAGLDLHTSRRVVLGSSLLPTRVPTDLSVELPANTYGRITGRSSANMKGIHVLDGVIDADYRGKIDMMVVNLTGKSLVIAAGTRIGQMIVEKIERPIILQISSTEDLSETARGSGGFGSTGM